MYFSHKILIMKVDTEFRWIVLSQQLMRSLPVLLILSVLMFPYKEMMFATPGLYTLNVFCMYFDPGELDRISELTGPPLVHCAFQR